MEKNLKDFINGKEAVTCPFYQKEYGCSFEDGELFWINNVADLLEKLEEYQHLEEQGRLIRLPCKVGDTVYYILGIPKETPCVIENCTFELSDIHRIGKTLFLTQEEAEQKLKEMEG